MAEEDDFFSFEDGEKEEKKSGIQKLEENLKDDLDMLPGSIGVRIPDLDYFTYFLVFGEIILLGYGALLLLGPSLPF